MQTSPWWDSIVFYYFTHEIVIAKGLYKETKSKNDQITKRTQSSSSPDSLQSLCTRPILRDS